METKLKLPSDKLSKLQESVRIGGKGTARRKKKVIHRTALTDDKKLQTSLKKLAVNTIPGIEEVNMIKNDGTVIHFNNPKVQASLASNTFAITGHGETKNFTELMPNILSHIGTGFLLPLNEQKQKSQNNEKGDSSDKPTKKIESTGAEEIPDLLENFDTYLKKEVTQT
ncbi:unnamed protein product [Gordionus sp. m RMFG-2023]|uniref:transcription factor BTF3 homolog 4-like n=1 Tax=Gordionus sp. m RMFG-2023 TaxID=3053472 RepID=UPI0030DEBB13